MIVHSHGGRDTEWEKVKEIYKLGLKHGMKLAAISGVSGVYTDKDIARVVALAKKARRTWKGSAAGPVHAAEAAPRKAVKKKAAPARRKASRAAPARAARASA